MIGAQTLYTGDINRVTSPIDAYFRESLSTFTLSADVTISTVTVLSYTFTATAGHGLSDGDEILFLDMAANQSLQAYVTNVSTNTITIDRPFDHGYLAASTVGHITNCDMAVDGSSTPRIFSFMSGAIATNSIRFILTIIGGNLAMDDSKFGNISALDNGLVFRIVNGYQKTIFNFKSNNDMKQFCYDVAYAAKAPTGSTGLSARITFGGDDKHGTILRLASDDVVQWVVQDDLTDLTSLKVSVMGNLLED
jgi:hypothetical protein